MSRRRRHPGDPDERRHHNQKHTYRQPTLPAESSQTSYAVSSQSPFGRVRPLKRPLYSHDPKTEAVNVLSAAARRCAVNQNLVTLNEISSQCKPPRSLIPCRGNPPLKQAPPPSPSHPRPNNKPRTATAPAPKSETSSANFGGNADSQSGQLAERAGISASFLGAVERGESDISVGRLSLIAEVLGHDLASLLGYSLRQSQPRFIRPDEHVRMRRGNGIELTATRIPGTNLELLLATLAPHSQDKPVTHAGLDFLLVLEGNLVLRLDDTDYPMTAGESAVWPSSHVHAIRNDSDEPARAIGLVTETVY